MNTIPFKPPLDDEPRPLIAETPAATHYPIEALGPLKPVVQAVADQIGVPVAIAAQSALATAALAVQGLADVETLGASPSAISLYFITSARSGERKSSSDRIFMQAVREFEQAREKERRAKLKAFEIEHGLWEQKLGQIKRKHQDGVSINLSDAEQELLVTEPQAPRLANRVVTEPTLEGLIKLFEAGQPSLGLFSDEGGQFLGGFGMSRDNRQKTLAGLNALWDGGSLNRTRAGDGTTTVYGKRMSLHLMIQPSIARGVFADDLISEIGFLARCLICEPQSRIGLRLSDTLKRNCEPITRVHERLRGLIERKLPVQDDELNALEPRILRLSAEAKGMLIAYSDEMERKQRLEGEFAELTAFASKAQEQTARLAAVITLYEDPGVVTIAAEKMSQGITLSRYYLSEAKRLVGSANIPAEVKQAEELRLWLINKWQLDIIASVEIMQNCPNKLRNVQALRKPLAILVEHGWLQPLPEGTVVRGKARKIAYSIRGQSYA